MLKIINVEPIVLRIPSLQEKCEWGYDCFLVKVTTNEGIVGYGSSDTNPYAAKGLLMAHDSNFISLGIRDVLIGQNPLEIQKLWDKMYYYSIYYGRKSLAMHVMSAIDIALWDIASQYYKVPIYMLLGGKQHDKIEVYATFEQKLGPVEEDIEEALKIKDLGFKTIKYSIGSYYDYEEDYKRTLAIRKALGDDINLAIDVCSRWKNYTYANRAFKKFSDLNLYFIEEPVAPDDTESYNKLVSTRLSQIAAGENLTGKYEFADFIEKAKPDIIQPDITRCGGISELRKIYENAVMKGCQVIPHDWSTAILISATVQFLAAQKDDVMFEYSMSKSPIFIDLFKNKIDFENGFVSVPDTIGLGLEINEEFVNKYKIEG